MFEIWLPLRLQNVREQKMRGGSTNLFTLCKVYNGTPLKQTPLTLGPPLCVWGMEVSGASSILTINVVMCSWAVEHEEATFSDLSVAIRH